jgi:Pyruvate/2-oxoacid:ferredoxin oxidoreductase delta subunit
MTQTLAESRPGDGPLAEPCAAVILCDCGMATPSQRAQTAEAEALIRAHGLGALRVSDLCAAVARRDPRLLAYASYRRLVVCACRPRAVRWLLHAAGLDIASMSIRVVDLRQPAETVRAELALHLAGARSGTLETLESDEAWTSWFPVVDYDRCQRCGQCASFCVFGVYSSHPEGGVSVTRPEGCKTNCPACARLCPAAAIVFPKHDETPFDGSEIGDEEAVRAHRRRYAYEMLGADPYAALAARRERVTLLRRRPTPTES